MIDKESENTLKSIKNNIKSQLRNIAEVSFSDDVKEQISHKKSLLNISRRENYHISRK
jgi:hypothetical protein